MTDFCDATSRTSSISCDMAARSPYSSRLWEPLDQWMESQGFYRKHTARDGSCLFRAVAEQVFHTQVLHLQVRMACVRFMQRHKALFNEFVEGSFEEHISTMQNPWEWAGELEMSVMSYMYRRDFLVFREVGVPPVQATANGFKDKILLCYLQNNQYDSVYPKDYIKGAAFCQSIAYHLLYDRVFKMEETNFAVDKMLHDKTIRLRRDTCMGQLNGYTSVKKQYISNVGRYNMTIEDLTPEKKGSKDWQSNAKEILFQGMIPFPYKVAKALDPDIYRNIEFDVWNDLRKELRWGMSNTLYGGEYGELRVGSKCLVRLDSSPGKELHAHIQEMTQSKGPVLVYIEELAEKCTVQFDTLEPLPKKKNPLIGGSDGGDRRGCNGGSWESHATSSNRTSTLAFSQNSSNEGSGNYSHLRNHRLQPWNQSISSRNSKFSGQGQKDASNNGAVNSGRCDSKSCSNVNKETSGRRSSGCRGRGRPITSSSSLQPVSQSVPRSDCRSSTLNQDQRYSQIMFTNHQEPIYLQPQPSETPTSLANQLRSPASVSCMTSPICTNENGATTGSSSAATCDSLQYNESWESHHDSLLIQDVVSSEEHQQAPWTAEQQATTCCCCSFPLLEWRPTPPVGTPTTSHLPPYVLPQCGGNFSAIQSTSLPRPLPPGVSLNAPESVMPDGGDLPYSDIPTLRFFYNLGHDYLRSGYFSWLCSAPCAATQQKGKGGFHSDAEICSAEENKNPSIIATTCTNQQHDCSTISTNVHLSPNAQQNTNFLRQSGQLDQDFSSQPEEDEKHSYNNSNTLHFAYGGQSQTPNHGHTATDGHSQVDMSGGNARESREDIQLTMSTSSDVSPPTTEQMDADPQTGSNIGRWLEASRHSHTLVAPYAMPVAQPTLSSPPIIPFSHSGLEGQYYVIAGSSAPHMQMPHHIMYGSFPPPPPHPPAPPMHPPPPHPLSHAMHTRFFYPAMNPNIPQFAVPRQG